jgi:hypothetical protein
VLDDSARVTGEKNEIKASRLKRKQVKLSLFANDIILYVEILRNRPLPQRQIIRTNKWLSKVTRAIYNN